MSQFIEMFGNPLSSKQKNELKKLGECCCINPRRPNITLHDTDKVSFVPMSAVSEDGHLLDILDEEYGKVKKGFTYFENNDVLFAKITPCMENGKGAIAQGLTNGIGMGSTEFHVLRPINEISSPYWLLALTQMPVFRERAAKNMSGTGGQKRVAAAYLEHFMVGVPSIEEQRHFEAIYKQADKSKFGGFKSQFIEMFGNTSKEMLGKFIQVIRGVSYKPSDVKTADDPDTAVILRSNNINDANLNTDEVVYIDKNRVSGDQYLRINDIVVCASNGSKALVGKAAINKTLTNQYAHGAFCLLVRPNDNINPVYLNTFFQTSLYKKQIDELAAGSNILNIKQEHLTNMILPLPVIEEQNKFAIIAEQADKSKSYVRIALKSLESMLGYCIRQVA